MKLHEQSLNGILNSYDFPKRFLTYFASQCAKDALSKVENVDERSRVAVDVAERYGNGEEFTQQFLEDTANAAYSSAATANAAYSSAYAAASYATSSATSSAYYYAYYAANSAFDTNNHDQYKPLLLQLIRDRMSKLEQLLTFGEEV